MGREIEVTVAQELDVPNLQNFIKDLLRVSKSILEARNDHQSLLDGP